MNVGDPTAEWAQNCVKALFDGAEGTDFNLFFSFDMYQHSQLQDHIDLFNKYSDHPNYMRAGPDSNPVVSSFGGSSEADAWSSFKQNSQIYLIPNLDDGESGSGDSSKYYTNPEETLSGFNDFVDGYFSWETAWPISTDGPVNVSSEGDQKVMDYAHGSNKGYMMRKSVFSNSIQTNTDKTSPLPHPVQEHRRRPLVPNRRGQPAPAHEPDPGSETGLHRVYHLGKSPLILTSSIH